MKFSWEVGWNRFLNADFLKYFCGLFGVGWGWEFYSVANITKKFHSSLLHDTNYVEKIKPIITESAEKYKNMSDKGLVWELIKLEIRNFTIPYCIDKKLKEMSYENELNKTFEALFRIVNSNNQIDDTTLNEFHAVKNNLDILAKNKARGIIFRSKCQWTEEGEKIRHTSSDWKNAIMLINLSQR